MGNRSRSHTERLARILDKLGEQIRTAPGEELLEAAREEGRDPAETTVRIRGLLQSTFKVHKQRALAEAKAGYQHEITSMSKRRFNLPKTAKGRRNWFLQVLAQAPQLQPAFTIQNRDLSEISDDDIESHLKKLAQLGVLDALSLPEEE